MEYPKVAILMSTYNGEKYLDEQILSIINQTYKNWHLYIRDDGSSDNTINIIRKYTRRDKRISLYNDHENVGVVKSFMILLRNTNANYYMFSDQDDYWLNDKVEATMHKALKYENTVPMCIYTNYKPVDRELNSISREKGLEFVSNNFLDIIFTNYVTGCTLMLNNELKSLIKFETLNYNKVYMHDWWIAMIAAKFGKLIYLDKVTLLYRQHGDNVVGSHNRNRTKTVFNRIFNISESIKELERIIDISNEFNLEYGGRITGIDKKYIQGYGNLKKFSSLKYNYNLVRSCPPRKLGLARRLFFKYLIVILYIKQRN